MFSIQVQTVNLLVFMIEQGGGISRRFAPILESIREEVCNGLCSDCWEAGFQSPNDQFSHMTWSVIMWMHNLLKDFETCMCLWKNLSTNTDSTYPYVFSIGFPFWCLFAFSKIIPTIHWSKLFDSGHQFIWVKVNTNIVKDEWIHNMWWLPGEAIWLFSVLCCCWFAG